jgi:hypothetical protein
MGTEVPWFRHGSDDRNSPGGRALRAQYGFEGWGRYQMLLEVIAAQPGAMLDLSKKVNRSSYALELGLSPDLFDAFIVFLADPDECGLIHKEGDTVRAKDTDDAFVQLKKKRLANAASYESKKKIDTPPVSESGSDYSAAEKTNSVSLPTTTDRHCLETNIKKTTAEEKPVDNSGCPPAAFDYFGMKRELEKEGIVFSDRDLAKIGRRLEGLGVSDGGAYAAYVIERSRRADPESLGGYVKAALMKYENWPAEYRASRPAARDPPIPDPGPCECGGDRVWGGGVPKTERKCVRCGARIEFKDGLWSLALRKAEGVS